MIEQIGSWVLTAVGLTGFILAGKKVWWAWYVNFFCQFLWLAFAVITQQWGFIVASLVYGVVFMRNAIRWTEEKRNPTKAPTHPNGSFYHDGQVYEPGDSIPWGSEFADPLEDIRKYVKKARDDYMKSTYVDTIPKALQVDALGRSMDVVGMHNGIEQIIRDLDQARASGVVYTYGIVQQKLADVLKPWGGHK